MSDPNFEGGAKNPYEAPTPEHQFEATSSFRAAELFPEAGRNAEKIRREYLAHETTVQTIGLVMYIRAAFAVLGVAVTLYSPVNPAIARMGSDVISSNGLKATVVVLGGLGAAFSWVLGAQLRQLKNWARWTILGLFGFATFGQGRAISAMFQLGMSLSGFISIISMVVNVYIVYVLLMAEDGTLFSIEYQDVLLRTPHLAPRQSVGDAILVFVTVATFVAGLILPLIGKM